MNKFGTIYVGNNVHIGMNSIIMPGVIIGENSIIGCGTIVTKSIPCGEVWGGIPAHFIETIEEYYEKNKYKFDYKCIYLNKSQKKKVFGEITWKK